MTIEVYEYSAMRGGLRALPILAKQILTIGSTATGTSAAFNLGTSVVTLVSTAAFRVAVGSAPTTAGPHIYVAAETPTDFSVSPGHKVLVLSTTTT